MGAVLSKSQQCSENENQACECVIGVSGSTAPSGATLAVDHIVTAGNKSALVSMTNIQQESIKGIYSPQQLVRYKLSGPPPPLHPFGLQYIWQRIDCRRGEFVEQYRLCRKLLGSSVEAAHEHWHTLMKQDCVHPVIKACVLSFSVISTPETTAYLQKHWHDLQQQMDLRTPGYLMVRFMCEYALAWAMWYQDLGTALAMVKAGYTDMKTLHPENFFLAPYYTVTIGRWIYEGHAHNGDMTYNDIMEVLEYADETLQLITTLEDDWVRIDTFGAKLSALHLLMLIANYCYNHPADFPDFYEPLCLGIDRLYTEISDEFSEIQKHSEIVRYDQAWFHSVSATYYLFARNTATTQEEKDRLYALGQCSIAQSACLYDKMAVGGDPVRRQNVVTIQTAFLNTPSEGKVRRVFEHICSINLLYHTISTHLVQLL